MSTNLIFFLLLMINNGKNVGCQIISVKPINGFIFQSANALAVKESKIMVSSYIPLPLIKINV